MNTVKITPDSRRCCEDFVMVNNHSMIKNPCTTRKDQCKKCMVYGGDTDKPILYKN